MPERDQEKRREGNVISYYNFKTNYFMHGKTNAKSYALKANHMFVPIYVYKAVKKNDQRTNEKKTKRKISGKRYGNI